jgi:hypothetical protein
MAYLPSKERYTLALLCLCIFLLVFGETIQPAPRTQIYETIICDTLLPSVDKNPERCKAGVVQEELAFIKGTERLLGAFPSELFSWSLCISCPPFRPGFHYLYSWMLITTPPAILAIPYGMAANRFGRRNVLTLALAGLLLEETWNFIICQSK